MSEYRAELDFLRPGTLLRKVAYVSVLAYFFSVPLEFSFILREPMESFSRVIGVIALIVGFAAIVVRGELRRWKSYHLLLLLYLMLITVSLLWDRAPDEEAEHALRAYYQAAWMLLLALEFVRTGNQRTQLIVAYLSGGLISAYLTMRDAFTMHKTWYAHFRYSVGVWNPNELAIVFAVGLPLAVSLAIDHSEHFSRLQTAIGWLYLVFGTTGMILTGSRTGAVAGVFGLGAIPFLLKRSSRWRIYTLLAGIAALIYIGFSFIPAGTWRILSTVGAQVQSGDLDQRVKIWRFGWQGFLRSPLFGSGVGSFKWASGTLYAAHNMYLEISVEQGIVGLLLILAMVFIALARLKRASLSDRVPGTFHLLTWALAATVGHLEELRVTWIVLTLAYLLGCDKEIFESQSELIPEPRPIEAQIRERPAETC